jgi:acyl dehydratase
MRFFEDIEIGQRRELGSFTFTAELIKRFATQFDPQRFHLDEEEGRKSLFGGLAASGWHIGSVCMKLLVADGQRQANEAAARGETIAVWGPSPGFRELRWIKPVLAGDTISFASEVRNGASCRPAIPAPTSAASWCFHCWRRPLCRGGTPAPEMRRRFCGIRAVRNGFPANAF